MINGIGVNKKIEMNLVSRYVAPTKNNAMLRYVNTRCFHIQFTHFNYDVASSRLFVDLVFEYFFPMFIRL